MTFRRILGFFFTDFLVTTVVIAVTVAIFASTIAHTMKVVTTTTAVCEVMNNYRADMSAYYALRGDWPSNMEELHALFPNESRRTNANFAKNIQIIGGAIDIPLQRQLSGKTLTLHPATLIDDPTGPVKWVAGAGNRPDGWSIIGEDHTTVEKEYVLNLLSL